MFTDGQKEVLKERRQMKKRTQKKPFLSNFGELRKDNSLIKSYL